MKILSLSLSFLINFLLFTTLLLTLSFSIKKKEEIKITFLESKPLPVVSPSTLSSREENPSYRPETKKETLKASEKPLSKEKAKEEREFPEREALLREKLKRLETKNRLQERLSEEVDRKFLQDRLAALQSKRVAKTKAEEEVSQTVKQSVPSGDAQSVEKKLSDEYLLLVRRKLQTHFEVPIYLKNRAGLSALVEVEVGKSGEIKRVTFLKKAEDMAFNQAVERCLRAVNPLPVDREVILRIEFQAEGFLKVN